MVANVTISQNPKERKKNLGVNLKYKKNLFSLKIHFPKKLLIFASLETKKLRMNICYLKIWGQKIAKSPNENQKKSVAANCYKP